jgi:hypothetical protein
MNEDVPWCTHVGVQGWSNAGWAWVHPLCGKPSRLYWNGVVGVTAGRPIIALPPRGISTTRARIGPDEYLLYTNFCIDNSDCYAVAYGKSEGSVLDQLRGHICPAPIRKELHPGGGTAVQKIWFDLDDTIDGIKEASKHLDDQSDHTEECSVMQEKSYASALAFSLSVILAGWYHSREDVLRQANRRWRMRQGEIPFEITPGYDYFPTMPLAYAKREDDTRVVATVKKPARLTGKKSAPIIPVKPVVREFSVAERQTIIDLASTGTSVDDLSRLYSVSPERIKTMLPKSESSDTMMGFMFDA